MSDNSTTGPVKTTVRLIVLFLLFSMLLWSEGFARWDIYKRTEIRNSDGNILRFDTAEKIRCWFILGKEDQDVFANILPSYQIDDLNVYRIQEDDIDYPGLTVSPDRWIRWEISAKQDVSERLRGFMNGQQVIFQYYKKNGQIVETVFSLDGAGKAISEIR